MNLKYFRFKFYFKLGFLILKTINIKQLDDNFFLKNLKIQIFFSHLKILLIKMASYALSVHE